MAIGQLRTAFWNVENLFDPAQGVSRGPANAVELDAKLDRLAACINSFFNNGGDPPDLLALAEVGSEAMLIQLSAKLSRPFQAVWVAANASNQTGLGLLYRDPVVHAVEVDHQIIGRPRCVLARCHFAGNRSMIYAVNHWKSNLGASAENSADRMETVQWIRQRLAALQEPCVIMSGDFNVEPFENYFDELHLRCTHHFSKALYKAATLDKFYNTSWRFLTEPRMWEDHSANTSPETRPKGTHSEDFVIWDQLLVSGYALRGLPLRLIEGSVRYHAMPVNTTTTTTGVIKPMRWNYNNGAPLGASDHFPLLAEFEIH